MEEWNYLDQIIKSSDYIALNKAIETYCCELPIEMNGIDVNNIPFCISARSDLFPKIIDVVKTFMEEYHLQMIYIGGVKFIYGEENN